MKKAVLFAFPVLIIGAAALWYYGRPAYKHFKERRCLQQARGFMAAGDFRNASLSAAQTLEINPANVEACTIQADLAQQMRAPAELDWRRRIADLSPTLGNRLRLASAALRFQQPPYPLAQQILDDLAPSLRIDSGLNPSSTVLTNLLAYHAIAAEMAMRLRKLSDAEAHFAECSRLDPSNELHQLNLAVLRIGSTNEAIASQARATLDHLRSSTNVGAVALSWLTGESLRKHDLVAAEDYCRQLLANPQATADDRLLQLTILQQAGKPELETSLARLQQDSRTNVLQVCSLSTWMVSHGRARDAAAWLNSLPHSLQQQMPVPIAMVDCFIAEKDWPGLDAFLRTQKWGEQDYLRMAFRCRAATEQRQTLDADAHWLAAVREAGDRLGPLNALLSMASALGRDKSREEILWQIGLRYPRERWTMRELEKLYASTGDTIGLNKLAEKKAAWNAQDFKALNDFAATSMLLKRNLPKAFAQAKETYMLHPNEPVVASTYAYALYLQGRPKEGLEALEKFGPEVLETPSLALYYGVLLSASGQTNKAVKYLSLARSAPLLPEEKNLLTQWREPK